MKNLFYLLLFLIYLPGLYSSENLNWEYASEGLDGYYKANLSVLDDYIYDATLQNYSTNGGATWMAHKFSFKSYSNGQNYYRPVTFYYPPFKFGDYYIMPGSYYSKDRTNWNNLGEFHGLEFQANPVFYFGTESYLFIQTRKKTGITYRYNCYISRTLPDNKNNELHFDPIETDFPEEDPVIEIKQIKGKLYATTESILSVGKYYTSTDAGMNWEPDSVPEIDERIIRINYFGGRLFATTKNQLWYRDEQDDWRECMSEVLSKKKSEILVEYNDNIITYSVIDGKGILVSSSDGGETWQRFGTSDFEVLQLINLRGRLIASTRYGIQISDDGGQTWQLSNKGIFVSNHIQSHRYNLIIGGDNGEMLTVPRNQVANRNVLMKSYDNGKSWMQKPVDESFTIKSDYAVTQNEIGIFAVNTDFGKAYKTEDFGESWQLLSKEWGVVFMNPYFIYERNDTIFFYSNSQRKYYYSSNSGSTFDSTNFNFSENLPENTRPWVIVDGIHLAITSDSPNPDIFKSLNSGKTWEKHGVIEIEEYSSSRSTILFVDKGNIFLKGNASPSEGRFFFSDDLGQSWTEFNLPLPGTAPSMWVSHDGGIYIMYQSTIESSIHVTYDNGQSWDVVSDYLGPKEITDIFSAGNYLFASTKEGLYRAYTGTENSVEQFEDANLKFFPIPAENVIFMKNIIEAITEIRVYDISGKEFIIKNFSNDYFDISGLEKGVYIAKLIFDDRWSITKKFIKY
jgi:photosystem II stability/assembly factor-like uncharacterized protein